MTDPKPPEPTPAPAPGSAPPKPYISPKLREKLEGGGADEEWSPKSGPPIAGIVITLLVVAAGVAGLFWLRSASDKRKAEEAVQARADSLAAAAQAESLKVAMAARADSLAKDSTGTKPAASPRPATPTSPGGTAGAPGNAAAPPAPASDGFGVAIGTYMTEDRANGERDRLAGVTGLAGLVTPRDDGGTTVYRVILGKFASRAAAERKAQALMDSSLVREANVVARPKSGS